MGVCEVVMVEGQAEDANRKKVMRGESEFGGERPREREREREREISLLAESRAIPLRDSSDNEIKRELVPLIVALIGFLLLKGYAILIGD